MLKKLVLLAALVAAPFAASAKSTWGDAFNTKYRTANTVLDDCNTCHGGSTSTLNPYGAALLNANISANPTAAFTAVEPLDSDRDGYTNLVEIQALTAPGDATDVPTPTVTYCADADADGYAVCTGSCELAAGKACGDCNDAARGVNPGVTEICTNSVDDNCDGAADLADNFCAPTLSDWSVALRTTTKVTVGRAIRIKAVVTTTVPGPASLIVFGTQNGLNIPIATITAAQLRAATYSFTYVPTAAGQIVWTAALTDETAGDADTATARTAVK